MTDTIYLLLAAVIFMGFIAYELAALALPKWHTVSWYAAHQLWIRAGIAVGLIWWLHHSAGVILK